MFLAVLFLSATLDSAAADSAARLPTLIAVERPGDPDDVLIQELRGYYESSADPGGSISISSLGNGILHVISSQRWDGVGLFDGKEMRLLLRRLDDQHHMLVPAVFGELVAARGGQNALVARVTWPGGGTSQERWVRSKPASAPGGTGTEDPTLPKYGDYVYVEELPEAIDKVPPDYPKDARRKGIDGTVMIQTLVGRDGLVKQTRVAKSIPGLDEAAADCVRRWRFKPATAKGAPVAVWVAVPIRFTLH